MTNKETSQAEVAARIKEAFEKAGLSTREAGKRIGVSATAVSMYMSGGISVSLEKIRKIAEITGVSPEYLAFGIEEVPEILSSEAERAAVVSIPEYKFGETSEGVMVRQWSVAKRLVEKTLGGSADNTFITECLSIGPKMNRGDYIFVNRNERDPLQSGDGHYLMFRPYAPRVVDIVVKLKRGVPFVTVPVKSVGREDMKELPLSSIELVGKVLGRFGSINIKSE